MLPFFCFSPPRRDDRQCHNTVSPSSIVGKYGTCNISNFKHYYARPVTLLFLGYPLLKFPSSFLLAVNIFRLKEGGEVVTFLNFNFRQVSFDGGGLGGHLGHHLVFT